MSRRSPILLLFLAGCWCGPGPEIEPATADAGHDVSFRVPGKDGFEVLVHKSPDTNVLLWRLAADPAVDAQSVVHLDYGKVPAGMRQVFPSPEKAPEPLVEGQRILLTVSQVNRESFFCPVQHDGMRLRFVKGKFVEDPD